MSREKPCEVSSCATGEPPGPAPVVCREIVHDSPAYRETVALRDEILRRPLGLVFTPEQLAAEHGFWHLVAYQEDRLVACLFLAPKGSGVVQMRQVAVRADRQGQGLGKILVAYSEQVARERGMTEMVLHARENAVAFYLRCGYEKVGEPFEEVGLRHWHMRKALGPSPAADSGTGGGCAG